MEFINRFKQNLHTSREKQINEKAAETIYLTDFDDKIYIAYNGNPMVPIDDSWTQREILSKLNETRNSFISYKKKELEETGTVTLS